MVHGTPLPAPIFEAPGRMALGRQQYVVMPHLLMTVSLARFAQKMCAENAHPCCCCEVYNNL